MSLLNAFSWVITSRITDWSLQAMANASITLTSSSTSTKAFLELRIQLNHFILNGNEEAIDLVLDEAIRIL